MGEMLQTNRVIKDFIAIQPQLKVAWCTDSQPSTPGIKDLVVSPDGSVAIVTVNGRVSLLQDVIASDGVIKHELVGQQDGISSIVSSAKELVAGGYDGFLKWWHLESGEELASTQVPCTQDPDKQDQKPSGVTALASSQLSQLVAAASGRFVSVFGPGGVHLHMLPSLEDSVTALAWLSDSLLAVASQSSVQTWVVTSQSVTYSCSLDTGQHGAIRLLSASSNGNYLAAASGHVVMVWDMKQAGSNGSAPRKPLVEFNKNEGEAVCVSWDSTNRYLAAAFGNELFVWNITGNGAPVEVVCIGHEAGTSITSIAFQRGGPLLGAAADDGTVLVFNSQHFGVPGLVKYVASGRVPSVSSRPCKGFFSWQSADAIVIAYESGDIACFETAPDFRHELQEVILSHGTSRGRGDRPYPRPQDGPYGSGRGRGGFGAMGRGTDMPGPGSMPSFRDGGQGRGDGRTGPARGTANGDPRFAGRGIKMASGPGAGGGFRSRDGPAAGAPGGMLPAPPVSHPPRQHPKQQQQQQQMMGGKPEAVSQADAGFDGKEGPTGWSMAPQMQWPAVQPIQYMMYPPMGGMPAAMPGYGAGPQGSFKPGPAVPPGATLSTSVWSPSAGMTMPTAPQQPVYMYQGQWPMAYMQQYMPGGYYGGYYGYPQAGPMPGMPGVMGPGMGMPSQAAVDSRGSSQGGLAEGGAVEAGPAARRPGRMQQQPQQQQQRGGPARQGSMDMAAGVGSAAVSSGSTFQPASGAFLPTHAMEQAGRPGADPAHFGGGRGPGRMQQPYPQQQHPQAAGRGGSGAPSGPPGPMRPKPLPAASPLPAEDSRPVAAPGTTFDEQSLNIFVGNLSPTVDESMLYMHFQQFGNVLNTQIIHERETGESRGFGFVKYAHPSQALAAMQHMNGATLGGPFGSQPIKVSPSRKSAWKPA